MKKTLIALIVLSLSFGVVGCKSNKEETTTNTNEVSTQEESKENDKRSDDEMYELYTSKLEEVESLFKKNNIAFEEEKVEDNKKYDGKVSIRYEDSNNKNLGEFSLAGYGISFEKSGEIAYIAGNMLLNVNDEEIKTKGFKFEEIAFYKLRDILIPDIKSDAELNEKVKAYYDGEGNNIIEVINGKVKERILIGGTYIRYTIVINP